jgi:hypothetical protein
VGPFGGGTATGGHSVGKAPTCHAVVRGGGHKVVHLLYVRVRARR